MGLRTQSDLGGHLVIDTDLEESIERKVASGQFQSRDEVIEAALEVDQEIDETDDVRDDLETLPRSGVPP